MVTVLHLITFALAAGIGWNTATGALPPRSPGTFYADVPMIAGNNLQVLVILIATNVLVIGLIGLAMFAVHGYLFGQMLAMTPGPIHWVWLYAPLEVMSFAFGASASVLILIEAGRWLRTGLPASAPMLRTVALAILLAVDGLLVAAFLEAVAITAAWGSL
jgi:hypothetical protein